MYGFVANYQLPNIHQRRSSFKQQTLKIHHDNGKKALNLKKTLLGVVSFYLKYGQLQGYFIKMSRICLQIALSSISGILSNFLIVPGSAQAVKNAHCHSPQALSTISTAGSSGSSGVRPQHSPVWNATTATTTARRTTFNKLCIFVLNFLTENSPDLVFIGKFRVKHSKILQHSYQLVSTRGKNINFSLQIYSSKYQHLEKKSTNFY